MITLKNLEFNEGMDKEQARKQCLQARKKLQNKINSDNQQVRRDAEDQVTIINIIEEIIKKTADTDRGLLLETCAVAIENNTLDENVALLIDRALEGDGDSAGQLANYFRDNRKDIQIKWMFRAADCGAINAYEPCGYMMMDADPDIALECFSKAAEQNILSLGGLFNMGVLYYRKQLYKEALIKWDQLLAREFIPESAEAFVRAAISIGEMYRDGVVGVNQDLAKAIQYYRLAAQMGFQEAQNIADSLESQLHPQPKPQPQIQTQQQPRQVWMCRIGFLELLHLDRNMNKEQVLNQLAETLKEMSNSVGLNYVFEQDRVATQFRLEATLHIQNAIANAVNLDVWLALDTYAYMADTGALNKTMLDTIKSALAGDKNSAERLANYFSNGKREDLRKKWMSRAKKSQKKKEGFNIRTFLPIALILCAGFVLLKGNLFKNKTQNGLDNLNSVYETERGTENTEKTTSKPDGDTSEIPLEDDTDATPASSFEYETENTEFLWGIDGVIIKKFIGSETEVVIPSVIEGKRVVVIEDQAFSDNANITSVTIKSGVIRIGGMNGNVFKNCTSLAEVVLPDTLENIHESSFQGCTSLQRIEIPEGTIEIGSSAFQDCTSLTSVTIPASMKEIYSFAFYGDENLAEVTFAEGKEEAKINSSVFQDCSSLQQIVLPGNYVLVGNGVFKNCQSLQSFTWKKGSTASVNQEMYSEVFNNCPALTDVYLSDSAKNIIGNIFENSPNVTLHAPTGSYAEQFAIEQNIPFVAE